MLKKIKQGCHVNECFENKQTDEHFVPLKKYQTKKYLHENWKLIKI